MIKINCLHPIPSKLLDNYVIISVSCISVNENWKKVFTDPTLPVSDGTSVTFKCPNKNINVGSKTGTCTDGVLKPINNPPRCLNTG